MLTKKGENLETRIERNFGMMRPEGYRKTIRLMKLADKFRIPIISFIPERPAEVKETLADIEKTIKDLGWVPKYFLEDKINSY